MAIRMIAVSSKSDFYHPETLSAGSKSPETRIEIMAFSGLTVYL